jgi:hypothetical protein
MATYDQCFYVNAGDQSTTGYYAVAKRPQNASVSAGQLVRQFTAPAVGSERVFVCIIAGITANVTDATWVLTRGSKTVDGTATWMECTGMAAVNGDLADTVNWTAAKAFGPPSSGAIIQRNSGASYQICTTAGTFGTSEPAFSDTAGATTSESGGTAVWTSLGVVGNFTGGQAPHARLANACASTWFAAGNTVYVGDNHAESQATAISISPSGTGTTIGKVICHNHSGNYPPAGGDLTTGATISATGAVGITYNPSGVFYTYGVTFKAGVGSSSGTFLILNSTVNTMGFYDNCSFWIASTQAVNNVIEVNASSGSNQCNWNNCTVKFANAANALYVQSASFTWQNTGQVLASGSVVPTALFSPQGSGTYTNLMLEALDLSLINTNIFGANQANEAGTRIVKDCRLNAAVTVQQSGVATLGLYEQVVRSDSGATAYKSARYQYEGTETTETSITRVGGAADPTGQAQSRKIVTTANSQWLRPFKAEPYAVWNSKIGATVMVTVYGTINAGALPNNDDIWLDLEYLGSSSFPIGTIVNTTKANLLAANAAVSSDSSTWNGGGSGAGWSPFKLTAALSSPQPGMAGYLHARVRAAKPGATFYIDPQISLS